MAGKNQNNVKRIVLTGPESTGKSALARQLAAHFETEFVPEFARDYLSSLHKPYQEADLLLMAQEQMQSEDHYAALARNGLLFCDTDLYVIKIWSEHKYGRCHPWILEQIAARHYDLFLLCDIDMPWEEDPLREHPDPEMRQYFFKLYQENLKAAGQPFAVISGLGEERLMHAVEIIQKTIFNK